MQASKLFIRIKLQFFLVFFAIAVIGQNKNIDSLKNVLLTARDTTRVNALIELANSNYFFYNNTDTALILAGLAYTEAKKLNYIKGMAGANYRKFSIYVIRGEFSKAIEYENEVILLYKQQKNARLFRQYRNLGWALWIIGENEEALNAYDKSLESLSLQNEYKDVKFRLLLDKAGVLREMGKYSSAYELYMQSIKEMESVKDKKSISVDMKTAYYDVAELFQEIGDERNSQLYMGKADQFKFTKEGGSDVPNNIAEASWKYYSYLEAKKFDSAYYYKRLEDSLEGGPFVEYADPSVNMYLKMLQSKDWGIIYTGLDQLDSAIILLSQAQAYFSQQKIGKWALESSYPLAQCYLKKQKYPEALQSCNILIRQAEKSKNLPKLRDGYQLLYEIYEKTGDKDKANLYYRKYAELKDQIKTDEFKQKLKLYKEEEEEKRKTGAIKQLKKEKQWLSIGIILLAISIASFFSFIWVQRKHDSKKRLLKAKELALKQSEDERRIASLEMMALRSQMNPHFIFNCLNSINRFVLRNDNEAASNYLTKFSKLIRMVLENSKQALIPLEEEVKCLELYIQMEQFRCRNSFRYYVKYHDGVNVSEAMIAPLLLQPFVENAIWHGLSPKDDEGQLGIEFIQKKETLYCVIRDNGIGRKKASELKSQLAEHHKSMGLQITKERLAAMGINHRNESPLEVEDLYDERGWPAGTKVTIRIYSLPEFEELKSSLNL